LPTARSDILEFGMKGGCAGLVEETSAFGSFAVCEAIWLLVPLFSIAAAYVSNRAGNNRLFTAAALLLPVFIALISFAFLGILLAVAEIAVVIGMRTRH